MDHDQSSFFVCVRMTLLNWGRVWCGCFIFLLGVCSPGIAWAAASDYSASLTSVGMPSVMKAGETAQVTVTFQNIGKATWPKGGIHFTSLYRWDPIKKAELASAFASPSWENPRRPMRLSVAPVAPGQSVSLAFEIQAPSVPGKYQEEFILAAEDVAWIKYSTFSLDIKISGLTPLNSPSPSPLPYPLSASAWSAELVERDGAEWQLDPEGRTVTVVGFKNTGNQTWTRDGKAYVSLYATDGKKERGSAFHDSNWLSGSQVVKLKEQQVQPGEVGHFLVALLAPRAPGMYREVFAIAAEGATWINGGSVTLPIRVPWTSSFVAQIPSGSALPEPEPVAPTEEKVKLTTVLLLRSTGAVTLSGNGRQELTFGFKNTGTTVWNSRGLRIKGVRPALTGRLSSVQDESWSSSAEPFRVLGDTRPGEIGFIKFRLKAPPKKGTYTASFQLYADGQAVDGGQLDIPITVTADGYIEPEPAPVNDQPAMPSAPSQLPSAPAIEFVPLNGDISTLPNEPMIRVGLYKTTDDRMVIRAKYAPIVVTQNGTTICRLNTGETASVFFDRTNRVYKLTGDACAGQSTGVYLFRTEDGIAPLEINDFSRPVSWLPGANDNTFRAQLELRYTPATESVWVINELPIEWYLKGIAETSNSSPPEFHRTLLSAARTYAMYHVQRGGTKHADESYTVDARYDQVYRGYGAEARDPNVVAAVDATRGAIVTYQNKLAITPYYSRSDGRTRAWGEVWGGGSQYPWLVSVSVPWDQGKTLWGHGVGMSATGALSMANEGKTFGDILKYFFPGTELRRAYK